NLLLSVRPNRHLLSPLAQNPAGLLLIADAGVAQSRIDVGLIAADDVLRFIDDAAAILNARVAADDLVFGPNFKIGRLPPFPDQERIVRQLLFRRRLRGERSIANAPIICVALPAGQVLTVEEADEAHFIGGT